MTSPIRRDAERRAAGISEVDWACAQKVEPEDIRFTGPAEKTRQWVESLEPEWRGASTPKLLQVELDIGGSGYTLLLKPDDSWTLDGDPGKGLAALKKMYTRIRKENQGG